jgi:hypothetical protein
MSTDDRHDDKPAFPKADPAAENRDGATGATPPLPEIPAWQAPAADAPAAAAPAAAAPAAAQAPIPIPDPIQMPTASATPAAEPLLDEAEPRHEPERPQDADGATRAPLGGPYVVTETGAPVAEQAVAAYDRQPSGGPYVTSSEPAVDRAAEPRTPYPAAAFAPAPAPIAGAGAALGAGFAASHTPSVAGMPAAETPYGHSTGYAPYEPAAPRPPRARGNRGVGSLIALGGTVVFALVYAAVAFVIISFNLTGAAAVAAFTSFLLSAAFIVPVVVFALALVLIVLIVNRAGWWAYVLGGFVVAVLVYFAGIAGALVHVAAWNWQPQEQFEFVRSLTMDPLTLAGAIVAREAAIWTGALIALRGRRLKARNAAAREEFARTQSEAREQTDGEEPTVTTTW